MRRWLLLLGALCSQFLLTAATCSNAPAFIARTQGNNNAAGVDLSVVLSSSIQAGDLLIFFGVSYQGAGGGTGLTWSTPSGWTKPVADSNDAVLKFMATIQYKLAVGGDASSTVTWQGTVGGVPTANTLAFCKGIVRVYRGLNQTTPVQTAANVAGSSGSATSQATSALAATTAANEAYVAYWADNNGGGTMTGPGDIVDTTADGTQWGTFEGDKAIPVLGTTPGAETANGTAGGWNAACLTMISSTFTCGSGQLLWNGANLN